MIQLADKLIAKAKYKVGDNVAYKNENDYKVSSIGWFCEVAVIGYEVEHTKTKEKHHISFEMQDTYLTGLN